MISVRSTLQYDVTTDASFAFGVAAATSDHQQIVSERFDAGPAATVEEIADEFGNRLFVVTCDAGPLRIGYTAHVRLHPFVPDVEPHHETPFAELPGDVHTYLRPSRYCEADRLTRFATRTFGAQRPDESRVSDICDWVHSHLDYVSGSTDATTTAVDVFHGAAGVCRDFAHLSIALCRAVGIPACDVSGYAVGLDPPDFHGFFEAFLDGRWFLFDATRMSTIDRLVRIATGRDAADTAFATFVGDAVLHELDVMAEASQDSAQDVGTVSTV